MYWYNLITNIIYSIPGNTAGRVKAVRDCFSIILLISLLPACKPDIKETGARLKYFDLKAFFKADSARLTKLNKPVFKTVAHNGTGESKTVHITNWASELSLFSQSDINKPAWKDSYLVQGTANTLIYTAKDPDLKTREIVINKANGKVKWILIYNSTKNFLYQTTEKLTYIPDSLYSIVKLQQVKLLGTNKYTIKGLFLN